MIAWMRALDATRNNTNSKLETLDMQNSEIQNKCSGRKQDGSDSANSISSF